MSSSHSRYCSCDSASDPKLAPFRNYEKWIIATLDAIDPDLEEGTYKRGGYILSIAFDIPTKGCKILVSFRPRPFYFLDSMPDPDERFKEWFYNKFPNATITNPPQELLLELNFHAIP